MNSEEETNGRDKNTGEVAEDTISRETPTRPEDGQVDKKTTNPIYLHTSTEETPRPDLREVKKVIVKEQAELAVKSTFSRLDKTIRELTYTDFDHYTDANREEWEPQANPNYVAKITTEYFSEHGEKIREGLRERRKLIWEDKYHWGENNLKWFGKMLKETQMIKKYPQLIPIMNHIDRVAKQSIKDESLSKYKDDRGRRLGVVRVNRAFYEVIAKKLEIAEITVKKYVQALVKYGFMKKVKGEGRGGSLSFIYSNGYFVETNSVVGGVRFISHLTQEGEKEFKKFNPFNQFK
jgi:hypothetical protein